MTFEAVAVVESTLCCLPLPPSSASSHLAAARRSSTTISTSFSPQRTLVMVPKAAVGTSAGHWTEAGRAINRRDARTAQLTPTTTTTTPSPPIWNRRPITGGMAVARWRSRGHGVTGNHWTLMTSLPGDRRDAEQHWRTISRTTSGATTITTTTDSGQIDDMMQRPTKGSPTDGVDSNLPPASVEERSVTKGDDEGRRTRPAEPRMMPVRTTTQGHRRQRSWKKKIYLRVMDGRAELTPDVASTLIVDELKTLITTSQLTVSFALNTTFYRQVNLTDRAILDILDVGVGRS